MKRIIIAFSLVMFTAGAFAQKGLKSNDDFFKRNPAAKSVRWKANNQMILVLRSGKEEAYNLNDESQRAAVIAKYGSLPVAPPPPPVVKAPPPPPVVKTETFKAPPPPPTEVPPPPPPPKVKVNKSAPPVIIKDEERMAPPPPPPAPPKVTKRRTYSKA